MSRGHGWPFLRHRHVMADRHVKRWSTLLTIRCRSGYEEKETSYLVGGNVDWYGHCGRQCGGFSKLRIEPPNDPVIPLLGIYLKKKNKTKTLIQKDIRIPIFVVSLSTVAKMQRQQMMDVSVRWVDGEATHTQNGILLSCKRKWDFVMCNDMDGLEGYLAKWNKSYRERQKLHDITYMQNLKQ